MGSTEYEDKPILVERRGRMIGTIRAATIGSTKPAILMKELTNERMCRDTT